MRRWPWVVAGLASLSLAAPAAAVAADPCSRSLPAMPGVRVDETRAEADHCIVRGVIDPRIGAGGVAYGIGFELRLPAAWNGRFLFQGGGGLNGVLRPALGAAPVRGGTSPTALARGYAVVSVDGGHRGEGAAFAADPQAWADFASQSVPRATRVAKQAVAAWYGRPIGHSYFMGCSNGGREAMMAAQRDPAAFDGVVAGSPGFNLAWSALEEVWEIAVLSEAAPIVSHALTDAQIAQLAKAALAACDEADGLEDGLIFDHGCRFDPAAAGLDAKTTALVRKLFGGAHDAKGRRLYADWTFDAGIVARAWRAQKLGSSPTTTPDAGNAVRGDESLFRFFLRREPPPSPRRPDDVAALAGELAAPARLVNADRTNLSDFARRGGRLLLFQGASDPVFSSRDLIGWTERARRDTRGGDWLRLFLSPGMGHCGGGPGLDDFDPLTAIEDWVERGAAPASLLASGVALPGVRRPLCAWPSVTTYDGEGFVCEARR